MSPEPPTRPADPIHEAQEAIRAGTAHLPALKATPGADRLRAREVLEAVPGITRHMAEAICGRIGVMPWVTLHQMDEAQLAALQREMLRMRA